ncbi:MAG: dihydroorotase [Deltaproteobacteria bacterium]|nr:dihydroorotase [Deltaproteobacteria bacterium]
MNDCFIINGRVIDPARKVDGRHNLIVRGGRVAEWTQARRGPTGVPVIDARDAVVTPGWIDLHTHLREPGEEYKEDVASGVAAAVAGGFASIVCMANTKPVADNASVIEHIRQQARVAGLARVYPIGAITRGLKGEELADIGDMAAAGVVALSDDGKTVANTRLMRKGMEYAATFGLPIVDHCEDPFLCAGTAMHEGAQSTRLGLAGSPAEAEEVIVQRDIALARLTGARLHVAHVSAVQGVDAVRAGQEEGIAVTAEVTPHHLLLTDEVLAGYDTRCKVNPPLRTAADRAALRRGLREGVFAAIATDHAPHTSIEKDVPFDEAACGMIGLESALPVCMRLVTERVISLCRLVELFTIGPARTLGLPRGRLAVGDDADVTILDPRAAVVIRSSAFRSKSRNCPFDGWRCRGKVLYTLVGGRIVYRAGPGGRRQ